MFQFTARINAQGQIIEWRGVDTKGDDDAIRLTVRSRSPSELWQLFQNNGISWLRPVSDPNGEWTIDPGHLKGMASGIEGSGRVPEPPLRVTLKTEGPTIVFTVKSAG